MWQSEYHDAMIDHDQNVGTVLDVLDELGIADDTIVIYSTDNGPHRNSWPDAGTTPFRSEKNTNWEGAYRVPELIRWPGKIKAGSVSNEIIQHHDWLPTLLAAAGDPDVSDKLKKGYKAGETTYKVHIDGFNLLPYLTGEARTARGGDSSTSTTMANWSACASRTGRSCSRNSAAGTLRIWAEPFTDAAGAQAVQPAHRSLRVRRHHVEHLLRLVPASTTSSSSTRRRWRSTFLDTSRSFRRDTSRPASASTRSSRSSRVPGGRLMLDSWNDGPTKSAIVDFVGRVTAEGPDFVAPEARVAVFDNDGTLWCEKPMYIQLDFLLRRFKEQAEADPALREKQPYQAAYTGDLKWLGDAVTKHYQGDDTRPQTAYGSDPYVAARDHRRRAQESVRRLLRRRQAPDAGPAVHRVRVRTDGGAAAISRGQRLHLLHRLWRRPRLHAADHRAAVRDSAGTGGRQFGRSRLPRRTLYTTAEPEFLDDGPIKPVRLWSRIGRRPIFAAGNSNGDIEMLEFTQRGVAPVAGLLVLHDDADREFDYVAGAEKALDLAQTHGWTVASMRNDWATVFSD